MGFFKSIFSSGKKKETSVEGSKIIRAEYKDSKYFNKEFIRVNEWIEGDKINEEKYLKNHNALLPSHYSGTYSIQEKKIAIMYSSGYDIEEIQLEYLQAIPNFLKGWKEITTSYYSFLNVISFCVLLNIESKYFNGIAELLILSENNKKNESIEEPDALLWFLLNFKVEEKRKAIDTVIYSQFKKVFRATTEEKQKSEKIIFDYLNKWYDSNKKSPWYNSHKRQWGYSGYWCWEAAAVVKVMGLDDTSFKDHPHYPYDMVHWQDNESI